MGLADGDQRNGFGSRPAAYAASSILVLTARRFWRMSLGLIFCRHHERHLLIVSECLTLTDLVRTLNLNLRAIWPETALATTRRHPAPSAAFVMSDRKRMPDPVAVLDALPCNVAMIFRHHNDPDRVARATKCQPGPSTGYPSSGSG